MIFGLKCRAVKSNLIFHNFNENPEIAADVDLVNCKFYGSIFDNKRINSVEFSNCEFHRCSFVGAIFRESVFLGCKFNSCDFNKSTLFGNLFDRQTRFESCKDLRVIKTIRDLVIE